MIDPNKARKSIALPSKDDRVENSRWTYYNQANCYNYAISLLLDISQLDPGDIAGLARKKMYTDAELVERVYADMHVLGLEIRPSTLEEYLMDENSWKIAVMNCDTKVYERYDYHFLRENIPGIWSHKLSDSQHSTEYDSRHQLMTDPVKAKFHYNYHLVGYFVLTKKDNS